MAKNNSFNLTFTGARIEDKIIGSMCFTGSGYYGCKLDGIIVAAHIDSEKKEVVPNFERYLKREWAPDGYRLDDVPKGNGERQRLIELLIGKIPKRKIVDALKKRRALDRKFKRYYLDMLFLDERLIKAVKELKAYHLLEDRQQPNLEDLKRYNGNLGRLGHYSTWISGSRKSRRSEE